MTDPISSVVVLLHALFMFNGLTVLCMVCLSVLYFIRARATPKSMGRILLHPFVSFILSLVTIAVVSGSLISVHRKEFRRVASETVFMDNLERVHSDLSFILPGKRRNDQLASNILRNMTIANPKLFYEVVDGIGYSVATMNKDKFIRNSLRLFDGMMDGAVAALSSDEFLFRMKDTQILVSLVDVGQKVGIVDRSAASRLMIRTLMPAGDWERRNFIYGVQRFCESLQHHVRSAVEEMLRADAHIILDSVEVGVRTAGVWMPHVKSVVPASPPARPRPLVVRFLTQMVWASGSVILYNTVLSALKHAFASRVRFTDHIDRVVDNVLGGEQMRLLREHPAVQQLSPQKLRI